MARSVLRVADQVAGVYPECCVLSGVETMRAVRVTATSWRGPRWLLGVPGFPLVAGHLPRHQRCAVALPVSPRVWALWRVREVGAFSTAVAGATFVGVGVLTAAAALSTIGLLVVLAAAAYRTRAHHGYWVTCRLHPEKATIVVEPTHQRFDEAARALFLRTLR